MASSRRHFLKASGAAGAALPAFAQAAPRSPNDKIQFATIGIGGMGTGDTMAAIQAPAGTKLVAVADVYQGRLDRARERWGNDLSISRDYREILNRKDIDAVIVSTPDHWHARIAIEAMDAGKDVYVQKPMVQKWEDGLKVIEAAKKTGRILQVGSQRVSSVEYKKAQDLFRAGAIGKLNMIEAWWDRNSAMGAWQYSIPTDATPANIDWDRFLGSAPKRPFEPIRLFRWRNYSDYGTGVAGDLFVHLFSGMHFVTGAIGPTRVFASGGLRFWKDGRDVPDILLGLYDYPETAAHPAFNLALRVNFVNGAGETSGFRFTGSEGALTISNGVTLTRTPLETEPGMTAGGFDEATRKLIIAEYRKKYPPQKTSWDAVKPSGDERWNAPRGYSDQLEHHANFFEAVRTRKPVVEDAVFGLRAAAPALLSNLSQAQGRIIHWDPQSMQVKG
jgi:predicted dehydrogenase